MQNKVLIKFVLFFIIFNSSAQENDLNSPVQESKIFQKSKIEVIQSKYLDKNGDKSHEVFLRKNGLYPNNKNIESNPYFTVSVSMDDIMEKKWKDSN